MTTADASAAGWSRYAIDRLLGAGATGAVHLAWDRLTGARVALKRCSADLRDRAAREASILAGIRFPGVVGLLDATVDPVDGSFLAVFEFIEGENLFAATRGASHCAIAGLFADILRALGFVHRRGLLHRDLKPENVLCHGPAQRRRAVLIDFGLATSGADAGSIAGTMAYLAPEVMQGGPPTVRSDLYSLGILLYQVLSGGLPSEGLRSVDIVRLHTSSDLELPPRVCGEVPRGLAELVRLLLRRDPQLRPGTCAEVLEVLARAVDEPLPAETRETLIGRIASSELPPDVRVLRRIELARTQSPDLLVLAPPGNRAWLLRLRIEAAALGVPLCHVMLDPDLTPDELRARCAGLAAPVQRVLECHGALTQACLDVLDNLLAESAEPGSAGVWLILDADRPIPPTLRRAAWPTLEVPSPGRPEVAALVEEALGLGVPDQRWRSLRVGAEYSAFSVTEALVRAVELDALRLDADRPQWDPNRATLPIASALMVERAQEMLPAGPVELRAALEVIAIAACLPLTDAQVRMVAGCAPEHLQSLLAAGLIERDAAGLLGPVSDAVAVAVRRSLTAERAARVGAEVARHIDEAEPDPVRTGESALLLIDAQPAQALARLVDAGRRLRERGRAREARTYLERALTLPECESPPWRLRVLRWLADCESLEGLDDRALARVDAAESAVGEVDDRAVLRTIEARSHMRLGHTERALRCIAAGLDLDGASRRSRGLLLTTRSMVLRGTSRLAEAVAAAQQALAVLADDDSSERGAAVMALANAQAQLGDIDAAVASYQDALRIGESLRRVELVDLARSNIARLLVDNGRPEQAFQTLRPLLEQFERTGSIRSADGVLVTLILCCNLRGDLTGARALAAKGMSFFESAGSRLNYSLFLRHVAEAELRGGNHEGAEQRMKASLEVRQGATSAPTSLAPAHAALARIYLWRGESAAVDEQLLLALRAARASRDPATLVDALSVAAERHVLADRPAAAYRLAQLAGCQARGLASAGTARTALWTAQALLDRGRRAEAFAVIRAAVASPMREPDATRLLLDAMDALCGPAALDDKVQRFAAILGQLGADGFALERARVLLMRADARCSGQQHEDAVRAGSSEQARRAARWIAAAQEDISEARRLFAMLGCVPWVKRADRLLNALGASLGAGRAGSLIGIERRLQGLERLLEINKAINSELDPTRLLNLILDQAIGLCGARRGFLILVRNRQIDVRVARNFAEQDIRNPEFEVSHSVACDVAMSGEPIQTSNAMHDHRLRSIASIAELRVLSILCVPLRSRHQTLGSIYLDHPDVIDRFDSGHLETLSDFAWAAGIALERARLYQENLERAEALQAAKVENERLNSELMKTVAAQAQELVKVKDTIEEERRAAGRRHDYRHIISQSESMEQVLQLLDRITETDFPALILGESGTGKELVANALHHNGPRRQRAFVSVNCAAMAEPLIEAELFGYMRGAFTGADRDRKGLFEVAHEGTLFLDEIGDMSLEVQKRLLRVLQLGEFYRVGGKEPIHVNVRLITATHRDLREQIKVGLFREDLYYRINVAAVHLPALRDRAGDVPLLIEHFVEELTRDGRFPTRTFAPEAMELLSRYRWPGNVRELQNEVMRLLVRTDRARIGVEDLPASIREAASGAGTRSTGKPLREQVDDFQRTVVLETLQVEGGNKSAAARRLGITLRGLYKLLERLEIGGSQPG